MDINNYQSTYKAKLNADKDINITLDVSFIKALGGAILVAGGFYALVWLIKLLAFILI